MTHVSKSSDSPKKRVIGSAISIGIVLILTGITIFNYWRQPSDYQAKLISQDLAQLSAVFERIDKDCKILSFDSLFNTINFLNVRSFEGSEVGPVNLAYPSQWKGPYLRDNPEIQSIEYQVVKTKKGYFITPGNGVKLPNGKVIGKDIVLDEQSDINLLTNNDQAFKYKNRALAVPLPLSRTTLQMLIMENLVDSPADIS